MSGMCGFMWTMGMFNVAPNHGEERVPGSWILVLRRRRWSEGSHRVAKGETWQVAGTRVLFNVALDHMRGVMNGGKRRGAYLREAYLRRLVREEETSDCPSNI